MTGGLSELLNTCYKNKTLCFYSNMIKIPKVEIKSAPGGRLKSCFLTWGNKVRLTLFSSLFATLTVLWTFTVTFEIIIPFLYNSSELPFACFRSFFILGSFSPAIVSFFRFATIRRSTEFNRFAPAVSKKLKAKDRCWVTPIELTSHALKGWSLFQVRIPFKFCHSPVISYCNKILLTRCLVDFQIPDFIFLDKNNAPEKASFLRQFKPNFQSKKLFLLINFW